MLKGLVGAKSLSREDMEPVLDKMRDHLIGKKSLQTLQYIQFNVDLLTHGRIGLMQFSLCRLTAKNVAAEISIQLCDSVAKKLEGKVMGTFTSKWA